MEIGATSYTTRGVAAQPRATSSDRARLPQTSFSQVDAETHSLKRERTDPPKVGFGSDSVKVPSLAANTIRRNVRQAEELIPTLEESATRVRERLKNEERQIDRAERKVEQRRLDLRATERAAVDSTRSFISTVNNAAGNALVRTGQSQQGPTNRLDIQIGDTQIPYDKPDSRQPLDLFA